MLAVVLLAIGKLKEKPAETTITAIETKRAVTGKI
jgi:hypothetical protein